MTFDLTPEQIAVRDRARAFAANQVAPAAADIDASRAIPLALMQAAADLAPETAGEAVVAIEEVAAASAALGVVMTLGATAAGSGDWPGLHGLRAGTATLDARARAGLGAVAVGIGRAALEEAVSVLRAAGDRPTGAASERPHWVLADAATEIDAARLLVARAAQVGSEDGAEAAAAQVFANGAAQRAVDAAIRVVGPSGYRQGSLLERLSRDARALALVFGTEEAQRAIAADATLPPA
ncbi:MAG: acyl-CoA dehydrogenase family protein [Vicinamibacterales bacterium]